MDLRVMYLTCDGKIRLALLRGTSRIWLKMLLRYKQSIKRLLLRNSFEAYRNTYKKGDIDKCHTSLTEWITEVQWLNYRELCGVFYVVPKQKHNHVSSSLIHQFTAHHKKYQPSATHMTKHDILHRTYCWCTCGITIYKKCGVKRCFCLRSEFYSGL